MKVRKIIAAMLLLALTMVAVTSCVSIPPLSIESIPELGGSTVESTPDTSEPVEITPTGFTERPKYNQIVNLTADRVVVAGTCEEGAVVMITRGKEPITVQSVGGYFIAEVTLASSGSNRLEMTAKVEDKEESAVRIFHADYKATVAERPDKFGVMVGLNSQLFFKTDYTEYNGENLLSTTEINKLQNMLKTNYTAIQEKRIADLALELTDIQKPDGMTDLEYLEMLRDMVREDYDPIDVIYVMVPSPMTLFSELVPEDMRTTTNTTRYHQVVRAFSGEGIETKIIDMLPVLEAHKNDGYALFSRTYSNWTDYAAYFAYQEVLKEVAKKYPISAPRPLSDFDIENKVVKGGDLANYLYLDRESVKDSFTVLNPKFTYTFPTGDFYNGKDDFTFNTESRDKHAISSRRIIKTLRENYPSAVIYRDASATPIYNMLAERFSSTIYHTLDSIVPRRLDVALTLNPGPDYVIVFINESSIDNLLASEMT